MAKSKSDGDTPATSATSATQASLNDGLQWQEKDVVKDEISKRATRSVSIKTISEMHAAAEATSGNDFWPSITGLADYCDKILRQEGYPEAMQSIMHIGDGQWRHAPTDAPERMKPGDKTMIGFKFIQSQAKPFSNAWYAAEIGYLCRDALRHNANNDADKPWFHKLIFHIATLQANWQFRQSHAPSILTGQKTRRSLTGLRESQNKRARDSVATRQALVADLMKKTRLTGGALNKWLVRQLLEQYGIQVSERTLRADRKALNC